MSSPLCGTLRFVQAPFLPFFLSAGLDESVLSEISDVSRGLSNS